LVLRWDGLAAELDGELMEWRSLNEEGLSPGNYTFEVSGRIDGEEISLDTALSANVNSVTVGPNGSLSLNLAGEFGDVYATSVLGSGINQIGSGVQIQDTSQLFTQGNVTFTENALDMAVNGNGFFVLSEGGALSYTRSGDFGLDSEGFVTANNGARLQGYTATTAGEIEPMTGDLRIQNDTLAPRQTTELAIPHPSYRLRLIRLLA